MTNPRHKYRVSPSNNLPLSPGENEFEFQDFRFFYILGDYFLFCKYYGKAELWSSQAVNPYKKLVI